MVATVSSTSRSGKSTISVQITSENITNSNIGGEGNKVNPTSEEENLNQKIQELERMIAEKDDRIKEKDDQIKEKDSLIKTLLSILNK